MTMEETMGKEKSDDRSKVRIVLTDKQGNIKVDVVENLRTDVGDQFWATRAIDDSYDVASGMKLGTGTAAVTKSGSGSGMGTYIAGSDVGFNVAPVSTSKGAGSGWRVTYIVEWAAGVGTSPSINEICLTNETPLSDTTSPAADTLARVLTTTTIDKQTGDTLTVTWQFDTLGQ